ncbi:MAG: DUF5302 domain-containing protein [Candidatus Nanopelagicales bacterium]
MSEAKKTDAADDDDLKRKYREALERKQAAASKGSRHEDGDSAVGHAHGAEAHQKTFRRRAGG